MNVFADQGLNDGLVWYCVEWDNVVATDLNLIVLIDLSTENVGKYS